MWRAARFPRTSGTDPGRSRERRILLRSARGRGGEEKILIHRKLDLELVVAIRAAHVHGGVHAAGDFIDLIAVIEGIGPGQGLEKFLGKILVPIHGRGVQEQREPDQILRILSERGRDLLFIAAFEEPERDGFPGPRQCNPDFSWKKSIERPNLQEYL